MDKLKSVNFKDGDLVITILGVLNTPFIGTVVIDNSKRDYPVCIAKNGVVLAHGFNRAGLLLLDAVRPSIFHATPENIAAVNQLYGCDLKLPMTPNEICKAMLDRGDVAVACYVSDIDYEYARGNRDTPTPISWHTLRGDSVRFVCAVSNECWRFAIPIDPRTGLEITEADLEAQS